jgi:osmotically-inducible protein OsmY
LGDYYEEFVYFDLPTHYLEAKKRSHHFGPDGKHADTCLQHDVGTRLSEICLIDHIDAKSVHFAVVDGVAHLKGSVDSDVGLRFIVNAIDTLDGIMRVENQLVVKAR